MRPRQALNSVQQPGRGGRGGKQEPQCRSYAAESAEAE
ncbi:hypothetical protein CGMCC3_g6753 [Colletotrichum fructicola]|nr:uncharacterized protein CGMCC3_g6753 [Colletotrichum fructicola]KAE9577131.1 hypothetical protein CGMCC3_g6753 [Colletotrichum fructicola]